MHASKPTANNPKILPGAFDCSARFPAYMLAAASIQHHSTIWLTWSWDLHARNQRNRGQPGVIEFCSASHEQSCVSTGRTWPSVNQVSSSDLRATRAESWTSGYVGLVGVVGKRLAHNCKCQLQESVCKRCCFYHFSWIWISVAVRWPRLKQLAGWPVSA